MMSVEITWVSQCRVGLAPTPLDGRLLVSGGWLDHLASPARGDRGIPFLACGHDRVQLVTAKIASVTEVASAFGVNEATLWRWKQAFGTGGVVGLVAERPGPRRPSKLTTSLAARIARLDATGLTLQQIAAAAGVSTATEIGRASCRERV